MYEGRRFSGPEVSQGVEYRFVDCNTDQAEGLTWDEVELCEVDCHEGMIKMTITVSRLTRLNLRSALTLSEIPSQILLEA